MAKFCRSICFITTALAGLSSASVHAQTQSEEPKEATGIEEIVVVARRVAENVQRVPVAVTALSEETLDRRQITGITQLQNLTPNLTFSTAVAQPGSATVFIRGQGSTDGLIAIDQAVGTYINGVYSARSTGGAFDLIDTSRVEVLRGPQGTLFGRNTTGGAINIIPNEPVQKFEGSIRVDGGNYDTFLVRGVVNVPLSKSIAVRVAGQHRQHGPYQFNKSLNVGLNDANSDFVRGSLKFEPEGGDFSALITGDYTDFRSAGEGTGLKSIAASAPTRDLLVALCNGTAPIPPLNALQPRCSPVARGPLKNFVYGQNGNDDIHTVFQDTPAFGNVESYGASGVLEYHVSDAFNIKSITAWRGVDMTSRSDNDGSPYLFTGGIAPDGGNFINQSQFSQELQFTGTVGPIDYILGAFYFVENGTDKSNSASLFPLNPLLGIVDGTVRNKSTAGYGQVIFHATDTLRFTGGLRYTKDDRQLVARNRDQNAFTGTVTSSIPSLLDGDPNDPFRATFNRSFDYFSYLLSTDWQAADGLFFYAKTSRSQRSGGFNTRVVDGGIPPASFSPEQVTDYEAGAKLDLLERRIRLNVALFRSNIDDVQRNVIGTAGTRLVSGADNAAEAQIQGLEAELTVAPTDGLRLGVNYGLTDAEYKSFINSIDGSDWSDAEFPYTPKHTLSFTADYESRLGSGMLTLHGDYAWRSEQFAAPIALSSGERVGKTQAQIDAGNRALQDTALIPSYGIFNARIAYRFDNPNLEIAAYAQNIGNTAYFMRLLATENTALGFTSYNAGDPRTYGLSATFRF